MNYYWLYLPALIIFAMPVIYAIYKDAKRRAAIRKMIKAKEDVAERLRSQAAEKKAAAEKARAEQEKAQQQRRQEREQRRIERERRQDEKIEKARQLAEYKERAAAAARELRALQKPERPAIIPAPIQPAAPQQTPPAPLTPEQFLESIQRPVLSFQGKYVSFTGHIPGMTREEAMQAVRDRGGVGFEKMPAQTNLLVVGDKPGRGKLDKADQRISQVKKITAEEFLSMIAA